MKSKKLLLSLLLLPLSANAFTTAENAQIKTYIQAAQVSDTSLNNCVITGDDTCVANWLNQNSTFVVWRTRVDVNEVYADAGFNFSLVDGLTQGKRDEWSDFVFMSGFANFSKDNIRSAIVDVWSGTAPKNAVQAAVLGVGKRFATRIENVFTTGTGTTATPGLLVFEGQISFSQIPAILRP